MSKSLYSAEYKKQMRFACDDPHNQYVCCHVPHETRSLGRSYSKNCTGHYRMINSVFVHQNCQRVLQPTTQSIHRRRTILLERESGTFGFTLQSYGIQYKRNGDLEVVTYVDFVDCSGPAYRAGLRAGDVIMSINGHEMEKADHDTLVNFIKMCGSRVRMVVVFEDCVRKVELHIQYIKLQKKLQEKIKELQLVCEDEKMLMERLCSKGYKIPTKSSCIRRAFYVCPAYGQVAPPPSPSFSTYSAPCSSDEDLNGKDDDRSSFSTSTSSDAIFWDTDGSGFSPFKMKATSKPPKYSVSYVSEEWRGANKPKSWDNLTSKGFGGYGYGYVGTVPAKNKTLSQSYRQHKEVASSHSKSQNMHYSCCHAPIKSGFGLCQKPKSAENLLSSRYNSVGKCSCIHREGRPVSKKKEGLNAKPKSSESLVCIRYNDSEIINYPTSGSSEESVAYTKAGPNDFLK